MGLVDFATGTNFCGLSAYLQDCDPSEMRSNFKRKLDDLGKQMSRETRDQVCEIQGLATCSCMTSACQLNLKILLKQIFSML